jgi:hypothetical protein
MVSLFAAPVENVEVSSKRPELLWGLSVARYACRTSIAKLSPNCSWVLLEKHRGFGNTDAV